MLDITIDLTNDVALIIPVNHDAPQSIYFSRVDIDRPGCLVFYKSHTDDSPECIVSVIPWSSIKLINFQKLDV